MSFKVVSIGEVLWDLLPKGKQLGGAPANFGFHARALGADACLISRVGNDEAGREIIEQSMRLGMPSNLIEVDSKLPTGTVSVELAKDGQPRFQIHENVAWDAIRVAPAGRKVVSNADVVCFGTLGQRCEVSREAIQSLVAEAPAGALRVFDINLRQHFFSSTSIEQSLTLANVLKLNDVELPCLAEQFRLLGDPRSQIEQLASLCDLRLVAYTRGSGGSLLFSQGRWSEHSGVVTRIVDTVGAGDSFTAAMTLGFLVGWNLDQVNEQANKVAAYVCSQAGATPALPDSLRAPFQAGA